MAMQNFELGNTVSELERLVYSGVWFNNPELVVRIVDRFMELRTRNSDQQQTFADFGTAEFWDAFYEYRQSASLEIERGEGSEIDEENPKNIQDWQRIIENEHWVDQPDIINRLFDQYTHLIRDHPSGERHFGTRAFWDAFGNQLALGGFFDDENVERPVVQIGTGEEFPDATNAQNADIAQEQTPLSHYYRLKPMFKKSSRRFGTDYGQHDFSFRNMENAADLENLLGEIFEEVLEQLNQDGNENDLVSFCMNHPRLLERPIVVPLRSQHAMTAEAITEAICKVLQSKADLPLDDAEMNIYFTRIRRPQGSGGSQLKRQYNTNTEEYLRKKRSIIQIRNHDDLCCARAIVTAKANVDSDPHYHTIRQGDSNRNTMQRRLAKQLMEKAGLTLHIGSCGPPEWAALQTAVGSGLYQIKIFDQDNFNGLIYAGPSAPKILRLWLHDGHIDAITSITAFFEQSYYCDHCDKAYNIRTRHRRCPIRCSWCLEAGKCQRDIGEPLLQCEKCLRFFNNQQCFQNHLQNREAGPRQAKPVCDQLKRCGECSKEYRLEDGHRCGEKHCSACKIEFTGDDHQCFIQPYKPSKHTEEAFDDDQMVSSVFSDVVFHIGEDDMDNQQSSATSAKRHKTEKRPIFIFYDMESTQDESIGNNDQGEIYRHTPNLIIAHKVCGDCCDESELVPCDYCKDKKHVFMDEHCLDRFCEWLFSKQNAGAVALAHNAKGYDGQFILEYCHNHALKPKNIICRGLEILFMEVGSIKFKDSLCFLPMALASLPKAFDVQECKKGYFPHLFNRRENWHYDGAWPDTKYYQPQHMKGDDRQKFLQWYDQQRDKRFNLQKELQEYCESDVEVLRKCCLKFRKLFIEIGQLDPLVTAITIASACNQYYRMHHLPLNTIGIIPHGGYRTHEKQSLVALRWLKWISEKQGIYIRHKLNGGEIRIGNYKVDGLYQKTIYEFYGCAYHGCPICFKRKQQLSPNGPLTMAEAYQRTMERAAYLRKQGYTIVEKWEHELRAELKTDQLMSSYFANIRFPEPLDPREALYGGRTNATVLYHKALPGEKIKYIDILSLYPFICKYGRFPTGHPQILTENFEINGSTLPYEGIIKCQVLPPTDLLHPLLPYRSQGKLTFPLCAACTDERNTTKACDHSSEERALKGAWVTLEMQRALDLGYRILHIDEVWHYPEYEQYHPIHNPHGGLFTSYINQFLRIKQASDGWPSDVKTEEDKHAFLSQWKAKEGIEFSPDEMIKNPGKRSLAKFKLNSFWGKFAQRSRLCKTAYFTDPAEYFQLVFDPQMTVNNVRIISENLVAVYYQQGEEFTDVMGNTNIVIAAYTTAQARLKLYSYIEKLQERCFYFDTDSCVYLERPGDEYKPEIGNFLGDMTDELNGSYITEWASGGPKHYGMRIWSEKDQKESIIMKVKGFRIDHEVSASINFNNLCEMIKTYLEKGIQEERSVVIPRIERTKEHQLITVRRKKVYRIVYDKRVLLPSGLSLPYGHHALVDLL